MQTTRKVKAWLRRGALFCAATLGLGAYAATPIAVWDGNFSESATINGATFNANGNTVAEDGSYVKITGEKGAVFTLNKSYRYITAVFTVSNLNETAAYDRALAVVGGGTLYGAYLQSGTLTTHGINGNAIWPSTLTDSTYDATLTSYADAETQRTFSLTQVHSTYSYNGTHLYEVYGGNTAAAIKFGGNGNNGLRGGQTYSKVVIGGMESYTEGTTLFKAASDLVILKVALYASDSTFPIAQADYATYSMPSMTVVTTPSTMSALNTAVAASSDAVALSDVSATITLDEEPSDATKSILKSAYWQGTVLIKDVDKNDIVPSNYGNPNSTLKLSGVKGYFDDQQFNSSNTPAIELEDSETEDRKYGLWQYNGYSFYSGASGTYQYMNTPELKGSGTYKIDTVETSSLFVADKFSNFTGKLKVTYGAVWLGVAVPSRDVAGRELVKVGTVRVSEAFVNAPLSQWTGWTVANGYLGDVTVAAGSTNNYTDNRVNFLKADSWKGTVTISAATNNTSGHVEIWLSKLGGANSTIVINDLVSGSKDYYLNEGNYQNNPTFVSTIDINGDVQFKNGSSGQTVTFDKVTSESATDKLTFAFPTSATLNFKIKSLDNFAGTLSASSRTPLTIVDIVKTGATEGSLLVKVDENNANIASLSNTTLNGESADLELKNGTDGYGIYVAVPAATVDITIPEVANATVSVTADGVAVTPVNSVVTVDIGAAVVVTYTAAEGYQLTGDAISFTASASTTTVDASNVSVAAIVANVTSADGQTTTPYTSAASAIAAADDGETVTLLENTVTLAEILTVSKSIAIASGNASGTTITGSGLSVYPQLAAANLTVGANVTFGSQLRVTSSDATITYPTGSTLNYRPPSGYQSATTDNGNGTTTITFYQQVIVVAAGTNATLADENGNQLGSMTPVAPGVTFVFTVTPAAGCALVRVTADGVELTPSEGKYSISIGSSNVSIYAVAGAAVVTGGDSDEYCSSLQAAVDAATSGQTVKLLADVTLDASLAIPAGKSLTLNLNGYTLTGPSGKNYAIANSGNITLTGGTITGYGVARNAASGATITVTDGTYTATGANGFINVTDAVGCAVTINGGTFTAQEAVVATGRSKNSSITVNGGTLTSIDNAVLMDNGSSGYTGNTITVTGGTLNGGITTAGYVACGIYCANDTTVNVTGGTFNITGGCGILARAGKVSVSGTTVINTTGTATGKVGDSRVVVPCAPIVYDSAANYPGYDETTTEFAVSGGTFTADGQDVDCIVQVADEGDATSIAVSGGTFNTAVADTYCAEGFEPKDNGNGTYGVRVDKGWIYEDADFPGYTGSWDPEISYGETTRKAAIEDGATYTASKPSAGQFVTLDVTASFDAVNNDDSENAGVKAAVRLGAGATDGSYVFQLYMTTNNVHGCWVNVGTSVEATTNTDYTFTFVLDMTNRTYTAQVDGKTLAFITDNTVTNFQFATAEASDVVQAIDFRGSGTLTSIKGSYEDAPAPEQEFAEDQAIGAVTLTADQAAWLNGQDKYDALASAIEGMTHADFNAAYLLNLDITGEFSYTFSVTDIAFGKDEQENETVVVTVSLTRVGALEGGINGTLKLMGSTALPVPTAAANVVGETVLGNEHFVYGNTATITFPKGAGDAKFFQPVIE